MKEYTTPAFLQNQTADNIHQQMLERLPEGWDKTQGQFIWDFTRPTAIEKARLIEYNLNETLKVIWPQWAYDEWLDLHGDFVSEVRRGANKAAALLHLEGTPGTFIKLGFQFSTISTNESPGIIFQALEACTISEQGEADLWVEAADFGIVGNVPADTIKLMVRPITGISYVGNPKAATGGAEKESDEEYRPRILDAYERLNESFVGCDADYVRWAKEINGVGGAITIPEWMGPGTGTVKLVVTDRQGQPANEIILQEVYNHIIRPDDRMQRLAPTDAILTVVAPAMLPVSIEASVWIDRDYTSEGVQAAFLDSLPKYYEQAVIDQKIRLSKIGVLLSETPGVLDYTNLLLNGDTKNIPITVEQFPDTPEVTLNVQ